MRAISLAAKAPSTGLIGADGAQRIDLAKRRPKDLRKVVFAMHWGKADIAIKGVMSAFDPKRTFI
jgi:hypothetical protein